MSKTKTTTKWFKRAILILAIIPILLFLGFAGAVSLIDFNQYKPQIEKEVADLTHRNFKIDGEVKVSILPFMFHLGDMKLKNKADFDGKTSDASNENNLMTMKEAQIELSLQALFLHKKIKVISLELIEPKIHFVQLANKNNWSDIQFLATILPKNRPQTLSQLSSHSGTFNAQNLRYSSVNSNDNLPGLVKTASDTHAKSVNLGVVNNDWSLKSLLIKNGQIDYTDKEQNYSVSLNKVNLLSFDIEPNKPFQVNSDFVYKHSQSDRVFDFEINANMLLAKQFSQLHLSNWQGVFRMQLPKTQNRPDVRLTTHGENLMIDFSQQQIYVKNAVLEGLNSQVQTSFDGNFGATPKYKGDFKANELDLKSWVEHLGFPFPKMENKKALSKANGTFNWEWDGKELLLDQVKAQVDDAKIQGKLTVPLHSTRPVKFDLKVKDLNLQNYLILTEQMPQGQNNIKNSQAPEPLSSSDKAQNTQKKTLPTRPANLKQTVYPIPLDLLQTLNAQGLLTLTNFTALNTQAKKVTINYESHNGQLQLAPFDIQVANGLIESKLLADLSRSNAAYLWKGRTKSLAIKQLANVSKQPVENPSQFIPKQSVSGLLDSYFTLKTNGYTPEQWAENLQGSLNADLLEAKVYGLDLNKILQGEFNLKDTQNTFTAFNQITVKGQFVNGIFTPKHLAAVAERFKGSGNGLLNLATQQVQGTLRLLIVKPSDSLSGLKGVTVPLVFKGNIREPSWSVDLADLSTQAIEKSPTLKALQSLLQ
ncbi:hypothetical protein JCM30760_03680 [Thiomicrorhabdus hydrogeniphila]